LTKKLPTFKLAKTSSIILLELYVAIDRELAKRLAQRAVEHDYSDIREVGEDFQNYLENRHTTLSAI